MRVWRLREYFWEDTKVDKIFVNVENAIKAGLEIAETYVGLGRISYKSSGKVSYKRFNDWVSFFDDRGKEIESIVLEAEDTED